MTYLRARRLAPLALAASLAVLIACEQEIGGPALVPSASLRVAPAFTSADAAIIPITSVYFVISRGGRVVLDTSLAFPAGADSAVMQLIVPLTSALNASENFQLRLAMVGPAGDTVFRGGPIAVTAFAPGSDENPTPAAVPLRYTGTGANAASIRLIGSDTLLSFGDSTTIRAEALDATGAVLPGTPFIFSSPDTALIRIPDKNAGKVIARTTARGLSRVFVRTLTGQQTSRLIGVQPVPARLSIVSRDTQTVVVNEPAELARVRVTAADSLGVIAVPVRFSIISGGGAVLDTLVFTDSGGFATARWRVGTVVGANQLRGQVTGLVGSPVLFNATGRHGLPAKPQFSVQPASVAAGSAVAPAVSVVVRDNFGNTATAFNDTVMLRIVTNPGGAALKGNVVVAAAGVATFNSLVLNKSGVGYRLDAKAKGVIGADTSGTFDVLAGSAAFIGKVAGDEQIKRAGGPGGAIDSLRVLVKDAAGNPVRDAIVSWTVAVGTGTLSAPTSATRADGTAAILWTPGNEGGLQFVHATTNELPVVRFAAVTAAEGVSRVWIGDVSDDWTDARNWHPKRVPESSDGILIMSGRPNRPRLLADTDVEVLHGNKLEIGAFRVRVRSTLAVDSITGSGEIHLLGNSALVGRLLFGNFPRLRILGGYTAASRVSVAGDVIVADTGMLTLTGRFNVGGKFETIERGRLRMQEAEDSLLVEGDTKFGGGPTTGALTNGVLRIRGNLMQTGDEFALDASGSHRTVFDGATPRTITFDGSFPARLHDLQLNGTGATNIQGAVRAGGSVTLDPGAGVVVGEASMEIGKDLVATTAQWQPEYTILTGINPVFPSTFDKALSVSGALTLGANLTVGGELSLMTNGSIVVNGRTLKTAGQLSLFGNSTLTMAAGDSVDVGQAFFSGGSTAGKLTGGTLVSNGDFRALDIASGAGSNSAYSASGTHRTVVSAMSGVIIMRGGNETDNHFNRLRVDAASTMQVDGTIVAIDTIRVASGTLGSNTNGQRIVALGVLKVDPGAGLAAQAVEVRDSLFAAGAAFNPDTTVFIGTGRTIPFLGYKSVRVSTTSDEIYFTCGSTVDGNMTVDGPGAALEIGCSTPTVQGDFMTKNGGRLVMVQNGDDFNVMGNAIFAGAPTELRAGRLNLYGNLTQLSTGSTASFFADSVHETIFIGAGKTMSFQSPGASRFQRLTVNGGADVKMLTDVVVDSGMKVNPGGALRRNSPTVGRLTVGGSAQSSVSAILDPYTLTVGKDLESGGNVSADSVYMTPFAGSRILGDVAFAPNVRMVLLGAETISAASATLPHTIIRGATARLTIQSGGSVQVNGDFRTENGGSMEMSDSTATMYVGGDATFAGGRSDMLDGNFQLMGSFTQLSTNSTESFRADPAHATIMNAEDPAPNSLSFASPGASRFGSLTVGTLGTTTLLSDVPVEGNLYVGNNLTGANRVTVKGTADLAGASLTVRSIELQGGASNTGTWSPDSTIWSGTGRALPTLTYNNGHVDIATSGTSSISSAAFPSSLRIRTGAGLAMTGGSVTVGAHLLAEFGSIFNTGSGPGITVTGNATFNEGINGIAPVNADTVVYVGPGRDLLFNNFGLGTDLRISTGGGPARLPHGMILRGNLRVTGAGSVLRLDGRRVTTDSSFATEAGGALQMDVGTDSLVVGNRAGFAGGSTSGLLTNGTLIVKGDFLQAGGAADAFAATGSHVTQLSPSSVGGVTKFVQFTNPDSLQSHFANVRLDNSGGAGTVRTQLNSDVVASRQLTTQPNSAGNAMRRVLGNGFTFQASGADADSIEFDNAKVSIASAAPLTRFENHEWVNMPRTVTQLTVSRVGDGTNYNQVKNLRMDGPNHPGVVDPSGVDGFYIRARRSSGGAAFTLTLSNMTPFTPSGRTDPVPAQADITGWP